MRSSKITLRTYYIGCARLCWFTYS